MLLHPCGVETLFMRSVLSLFDTSILNYKSLNIAITNHRVTYTLICHFAFSCSKLTTNGLVSIWRLPRSLLCSSLSTSVFSVFLENLTAWISESCLSTKKKTLYLKTIWILDSLYGHTFCGFKEKYFSSKDIYETLFFESLWTEVNRRRMHFVEKDVHQPS